MHVLIAPNAFKHGLSADAAANAIADGLHDSGFRGSWAQCPVADGGDGTALLLSRYLKGRRVRAAVHDALGRPVDSHFMLLHDGRTAVIELADASGLRLLHAHERDPLRATTGGTGELIRLALDSGAREILLCAGGSATVDGGAGMLRALGVEFTDARRQSLTHIPEKLTDLAQIHLAGLDPRLSGAVTVLCDVDNALLGEHGAARVFGPQKGADAAAVRTLESGLARLADAIYAATGRRVGDVPRGGAAGGVAAGALGVLGAELKSGTDFFLDCIDFTAALRGADVVITGEGSIDEQTAHGKAPWGVALRAKARGALVIGLAGQVPSHPSGDLRAGFDVLLPIGGQLMELDEAIKNTRANLHRAAFELGRMLQWAGTRSAIPASGP